MNVHMINTVTIPKTHRDFVDLLLGRARDGFAEIDPECKDEPAPILHALQYGKAELGAIDPVLVSQLLEMAWVDYHDDTSEVEAGAQWLVHIFNIVAFCRFAYDFVEETNKNQPRLERRREDLRTEIALIKASTPTTFEEKYLPTVDEQAAYLSTLQRNLCELDRLIEIADLKDPATGVKAVHPISQPNITEAAVELTVAFERRMQHLLLKFPGAFVANESAFMPGASRDEVLMVGIEKLTQAQRKMLHSDWSGRVRAWAPRFVSTALSLAGWPRKHTDQKTLRRTIFAKDRTAYRQMSLAEAFMGPVSETTLLVSQFVRKAPPNATWITVKEHRVFKFTTIVVQPTLGTRMRVSRCFQMSGNALTPAYFTKRRATPPATASGKPKAQLGD